MAVTIWPRVKWNAQNGCREGDNRRTRYSVGVLCVGKNNVDTWNGVGVQRLFFPACRAPGNRRTPVGAQREKVHVCPR